MNPTTGLRVAAAVEVTSLAVLLLNLVTVHQPQVAAAVGPVHGCAYLFVVLLTALRTRAVRLRLLSWVPGVGGLLVLRRPGPAGTASTLARWGIRGQGD